MHLDPVLKPAVCSCLIPHVIAQLWLYYFSYEQMEGKYNRRAAELAGAEDKGVERVGGMWSDMTRDQDGNDETIA